MLQSLEAINNIDINRFKIPYSDVLSFKNKEVIKNQFKPLLDFLVKVFNKGKSIQMDTWKNVNQMIQIDPKFITETALIKMIASNLMRFKQSIQELTNLPTRQDIDTLIRAIDALDAKVQTLLAND